VSSSILIDTGLAAAIVMAVSLGVFIGNTERYYSARASTSAKPSEQ
jgi:predicted MFS family arabinose efflux permease